MYLHKSLWDQYSDKFNNYDPTSPLSEQNNVCDSSVNLSDSVWTWLYKVYKEKYLRLVLSV